MAVTFLGKGVQSIAPPWERPPGVESAVEALERKGKYGDQVNSLMLRNRNNNKLYQVVRYDLDESRVKLISPDGLDLGWVAFGERENRIYEPVWR